jgi:hypothetical protein
MSKNLMLLFKLLNIYLKNMNNYLLSHITLFSGRKCITRLQNSYFGNAQHKYPDNIVGTPVFPDGYRNEIDIF